MKYDHWKSEENNSLKISLFSLSEILSLLNSSSDSAEVYNTNIFFFFFLRKIQTSIIKFKPKLIIIKQPNHNVLNMTQ